MLPNDALPPSADATLTDSRSVIAAHADAVTELVGASAVQIELLPAEPALVQEELALLPPTEPTVAEQLAGFDRAHVGKSKSEFSARNRTILVMRGDDDPLEKIARTSNCAVATVKWVLKMARDRNYDRLVSKARPGRTGKRQQIIDALRKGIPPREVERQIGTHRTTVLRARHLLQNLTVAA